MTFTPLWKTMREKGVTAYTLRVKYTTSHTDCSAAPEKYACSVPVGGALLRRGEQAVEYHS